MGNMEFVVVKTAVITMAYIVFAAVAIGLGMVFRSIWYDSDHLQKAITAAKRAEYKARVRGESVDSFVASFFRRVRTYNDMPQTPRAESSIQLGWIRKKPGTYFVRESTRRIYLTRIMRDEISTVSPDDEAVDRL